MEKTMDKIVALAKSRGFVYPGSEIYGGLANTWDYGNLGVELKNNVKRAWWKKFIMENPYNVGVDCAILMNPQTWVASGHLGGFSDPLMDCKECHERFRADKLIEDLLRRQRYPAGEFRGCLEPGRDEGLHRRAQDSLPLLRQTQFHRHPSVQPDVQDLPGCHRGCEEHRISPSGNCTGYLRKLQERTENFQKESSLRNRPDR